MKNILVVGDSMIDVYTSGDATKLSPEAPVPDFCKSGVSIRKLGGAANTTTILANLNTDAEVGLVTGMRLMEESEQESFEVIMRSCKELNKQFKFYPVHIPVTTIKERLIDEASHQQVLRISIECSSPKIDNKLFETQLSKISNPGLILISDYDKGILNGRRIDIITGMFYDVPIIVDPKVKNFWQYGGATVITPNHKEVADALGIHPKYILQEPVRYAEQLMGMLPVSTVVITLGKIGAAVSSENVSELVRTQEKQVFDVTGSGDIFCAILSWLWINSDRSLIEKVQIANYVAGVGVTYLGNYIAVPEDIKKGEENLG